MYTPKDISIFFYKIIQTTNFNKISWKDLNVYTVNKNKKHY